jgi:hypothetical protein
MRSEQQSAAPATPDRDNSPTPTPMPMTSSQPDRLLLSGIFTSAVFVISCYASARGHDLRELVKAALCIACPPLRLKIIDLKQADGSYPSEEDAGTAIGAEIRYTVKIADMFPPSCPDGRVQFLVEMVPEKPAATATAAAKAASPRISSPCSVRLGPVGKRVRASSSDEQMDVKVKKPCESSGSTGEVVNSLKRVIEELQRIVDGGEWCA